VRVFGSVARGDAGPGSDLDLLVEMDRRSLFKQAALRHVREDARERIEREAVSL
jgi:predicted nucleotidyltransferase